MTAPDTTLPTGPAPDLEPPAFEDYFGFAKNEKYVFPDGKQYLEFAIMNEGKKAQFQKLTQRDLVLERNSGNARMKVDPSQERHELLRQSIVDWNLYRQGQSIPFSSKALKDFLELADPKVVEDIEKTIRKANPWLLSDMSVEDIDKEIENLQEMRKVAEERERGNDS